MKILSLGGNLWQIGLIDTIRQLSHKAYVADINPDCLGRSHADYFIEADISNRDVVLQIARTHEIDLVIAEQSDRFVLVAAYVNETLGLPGIGIDIARRFTDKFEMRCHLEGLVKMPAYIEVQSLEVALQFVVVNGYPLVIKPKSAQSSYGVFKVDNEAQLRKRFFESLTFSKDGKILLESFIDGPEITVEALSIDGRCIVLAVSEKEHYALNPCVAKKLSYPPRYSAQRMANIHAASAKVVQALGLDNGISHAEYRMSGDTPFLVEVAARGGGTKIASIIVPYVAQFSIYEMLLRHLCGEIISIPAPASKAAVLMFFDFPSGVVKRIDGLSRINDEELAFEVVLNFEVGDLIESPEDDTQRLGYAIVLGEDRDVVDARCKRLQELLVVEFE